MFLSDVYFWLYYISLAEIRLIDNFTDFMKALKKEITRKSLSQF